MKKLILAALIALTTAPALAANEQIVFSTPNLAMPFEVHMQRTAVNAAKEMGVKLQVLDSQGVRQNRLLTWRMPSLVVLRALSSLLMILMLFQARSVKSRTLIYPSSRWIVPLLAINRCHILVPITTRAARL